MIADYSVSLGGAPEGHKLRECDESTPTGTYIIDWRDDRSVAQLSLHISYADDADIARVEAASVSSGGKIMIQGMLNGWGWIRAAHLWWD